MPTLDPNWGAAFPHDLRPFLTHWAAAVADALAAQLPDDTSRAELAVRSRQQTEAAVAAAETRPPGGYDPPPPAVRGPARFFDRVGVSVTGGAGGPAAAAVLFVSPDDKRDSDAALGLAAAVTALLHDGAGVVVVDAVPGAPLAWATHLHSLIGIYPLVHRRPGVEMATLAVCPTFRDGAGGFDAWHSVLKPGGPLPVVPLAVRGGAVLRLDLEATYAAECGRSGSH